MSFEFLMFFQVKKADQGKISEIHISFMHARVISCSKITFFFCKAQAYSVNLIIAICIKSNNFRLLSLSF